MEPRRWPGQELKWENTGWTWAGGWRGEEEVGERDRNMNELWDWS